MHVVPPRPIFSLLCFNVDLQVLILTCKTKELSKYNLEGLYLHWQPWVDYNWSLNQGPPITGRQSTLLQERGNNLPNEVPRTLSLYQQAHWKNPSLSFRLLFQPWLSIEETEAGGWSSFNSKNKMFDINSITFSFHLSWSLHYMKMELGHINWSLKLHLPSSKCSGSQSVSIRFVICISSKKISTYKREINNRWQGILSTLAFLSGHYMKGSFPLFNGEEEHYQNAQLLSSVIW